MDTIATIGLDIAKSSFSAYCADASCKTVRKAELKRSQVLPFFAEKAPCKVGLEACGSAHHWAREIAKLGHEVKLIPAGRVKTFVLRQKNDAADARAITEAMAHPETRYVPAKTLEQQANLMLFKARDLLVSQRTRMINAPRGHFSEAGIVVPLGAKEAYGLVGRLAEDDGALPEAMKRALKPLASALVAVSREIAGLERAILEAHRADATAKRLAEVPGIGTLTSMVLSASVTEPQAFKGGREFAAYLGLVPMQYTTGGKPRLGRITKMGNRDIRRLLVVGAIAALARMKHGKTTGPLADWARKLLQSKPFRLVAVALANKMARIAWIIMAKGGRYDAAHGSKTMAAAAA
jgi:transposase